MIEADRRNGARRRRHHVGRIESAAEANLYYRNRDAGASEQLERDGGRRFEERRMHRQIAGRAKAVGTVEHVLCGAFERRHQRVRSR